MEMSSTRSNAATAPTSSPPRPANDRAQRQELAQKLETEKHLQDKASVAYLNAQGQATGRVLDATA